MNFHIWLINILVMASGTACVFLCLPWIFKWYQNRRRQQYQQLVITQFPYTLQILSASLRAGITLSQALQHLGDICPAPICYEWRTLYHEHKLGIDIDQALENFSKRNPSADIAMTTSMLQIAYSSGGAIAPILEKMAHTMQQQTFLREKVIALTAQGRLQGKILAALPIILLLALEMIDPASTQALWQTSEGWIALTAIIILESLGISWIHRLTRAPT